MKKNLKFGVRILDGANKILLGMFMAIAINAAELPKADKEFVKNKMSATQAEIKATHALIAAVRQEKHAEAEVALKAGAKLEDLSFSDPVILLAIHNSDEKMIRLLLEHKANVNCDVDKHLISTPLMQSTTFATPSIFKLILDNKADVKYKARLFFGEETVLCRLVTPHISCRFSEDDRISCIAQVMERSELDESDIEFAYEYIQSTQPYTIAHEWTQDQRTNAKKFLDYARDCKTKKEPITSEKSANSDRSHASENDDSDSSCVIS